MPQTVAATESPQTKQPAHTRARPGTGICLIGGKSILRHGIAEILRGRGHRVEVVGADEQEDVEGFLASAPGTLAETDLLLLILTGKPFGTIHRVREALEAARSSVPLVVLGDQIGRGQVYAALRIGAKAYLDLECDPEELCRAIAMAATNKVYLSPDVAELLVSDVSAGLDSSRGPRPASLQLSQREVEVVQFLCEGLSSKEIARKLHLSTKTVENHRYNIYRKCEVDSIAALMRHAIQHGLVTV